MVRLVEDGEAAIGVAMSAAVLRDTLTVAVESLDLACRDLDDAVLAMPNVRGDDVMASPKLVALLVRVVAARRDVRRLELEVKAAIEGILPASTLS